MLTKLGLRIDLNDVTPLPIKYETGSTIEEFQYGGRLFSKPEEVMSQP